MGKSANLAALPLFSLFRTEPAAAAARSALMTDETPAVQADAAQAKMEFVLRLRARGISDVNVLRALEIIPRESFAPHRYRDLALRDVALPIACGQTMQEPLLVARMIEALRVEQGQKVLEIGAGSGYASAVLARLTQDVTSVERFQSLVTAARTRLDALGIANVTVIHADGLALPPDMGPFDRILVHGRLDTLPDSLICLLAEEGCVVAGLMSEGAPRIVRWRHAPGGLMQDSICEGRLQRLIPGLAAVL